MSLHRKLNVKIFLMFIVAENTRSVNINLESQRSREKVRGWSKLSLFDKHEDSSLQKMKLQHESDVGVSFFDGDTIKEHIHQFGTFVIWDDSEFAYY